MSDCWACNVSAAVLSVPTVFGQHELCRECGEQFYRPSRTKRTGGDGVAVTSRRAGRPSRHTRHTPSADQLTFDFMEE